MDKKELKIEDYANQLKEICITCRKSNKCKDHDKLCVAKKLTWTVAKKVYAQRLKKGEINDCR